jgi:hypothetical protein
MTARFPEIDAHQAGSRESNASMAQERVFGRTSAPVIGGNYRISRHSSSNWLECSSDARSRQQAAGTNARMNDINHWVYPNARHHYRPLFDEVWLAGRIVKHRYSWLNLGPLLIPILQQDYLFLFHLDKMHFQAPTGCNNYLGAPACRAAGHNPYSARDIISGMKSRRAGKRNWRLKDQKLRSDVNHDMDDI